jgi:hypothetical protein
MHHGGRRLQSRVHAIPAPRSPFLGRDIRRSSGYDRFIDSDVTPKTTGGKGGRFERAGTGSQAEPLRARLQRAETALGREREARQRLERALAAERVRRRAAEEDQERLERARANLTLLEQQVEITWSQLVISEQELLWARRPLWRKLLRRPPKAPAKH